jgi:hypothetical protein
MTYNPIPEIIDNLPNVSGAESQIQALASQKKPAFLDRTPLRLESMRSAFGIALHMHQPLILDGSDLRTARMIGNLQYMMENQHIHGNHDAPAFASCYSRIADFIRELVNVGRSPRVMLDYSGCLLFGLRQMGRGDVLDNLKEIAQNDRYWPYVEWLGTMWGHAVPASTPVPDLKLHIKAWRQHFASIFGWNALERVRGFSPPEMSLPNNPDVCFEYVRSLRESGYSWLLVQEHSVEELDGHGLRERYLPRRLVARNSKGEEASITALIKTQGSDTKLIGQMQPFYEAQTQSPRDIHGIKIPPICLQISDGENGGVMMNEFPANFKQAWHQLGTEGVVGVNGAEYLELLANSGIAEKDFSPVQPLFQYAIWSRVGSSPGPEAITRAIEDAKKADHRFHMDGGSWTNNLSWVRHYENVLDPMNKFSIQFHEKLDNKPIDKAGAPYRNALLHLLVAETSCYRYWGQGRWTDYAVEICRRGSDILRNDFPN